MDDDDFSDALAVGTGYALYRHGQDRLAAQISGAVRAALDDWEPVVGDEPAGTDLAHEAELPRPVELDRTGIPREWEDFIGQEPLAEHLQTRIAAAQVRRGRLPHMLFLAQTSGMGRRALARLAAYLMGVQIIELTAPFDLATLRAAVEQLKYRDILFIDDLERAGALGSPGAGVLRHVMEENELTLTNGEVGLPGFTVIGSTTRPDLVGGVLMDCLPVFLEFAPYAGVDRARLAMTFAFLHRSEDLISNRLASDIAAVTTTPRHVESFVLAARDLALALGRNATGVELFEFMNLCIAQPEDEDDTP